MADGGKGQRVCLIVGDEAEEQTCAVDVAAAVAVDGAAVDLAELGFDAIASVIC